MSGFEVDFGECMATAGVINVHLIQNIEILK